jgi:hypothetical protein
MKCDIAYFQETHFDQNTENEINFNTDFNVYGSIGTSASRGVAILIVNCCLFSLYILQTSINLLVFIKDFKLFTDCLQTLPVRKLLRSW